MKHKQSDGRPGSSIPGSSLVREYCHSCGDAIRVNQSEYGMAAFCQKCRPEIPKQGIAATRDDISPWQENAIRELEDRNGERV